MTVTSLFTHYNPGQLLRLNARMWNRNLFYSIIIKKFYSIRIVIHFGNACLSCGALFSPCFGNFVSQIWAIKKNKRNGRNQLKFALLYTFVPFI